MTDFYFNFSVTSSGLTSSAYLAVSFSSGNLQNGAATLSPSQARQTYISFSNQFAMQFAPGAFNVGLVVTASDTVSGTILVSPAVNSAITGTLTAFGKVLGTVTLAAGQTEAPFNFPVTEGMSEKEAEKSFAEDAPKP